MLKTEFHISKLLAGYFRNQLSAHEEEELNKWKEASDDNRVYFDQLNDWGTINEKHKKFQTLKLTQKAEIWNKTIQGLAAASDGLNIASTKEKVAESKWRPLKYIKIPLKYKAAWLAAAALLITVGVLLWHLDGDRAIQELPPGYANDVSAGITKATLTLANGKKVILSGAAEGQIAEESGVSISKTSSGKLVYTILPSKETSEDTQYNTLSTSNGEQYQVILPDQSKVWLNAASSITYPTSFAHLKNREVTAKGEIYFEIAKDKTHPFMVKTNRQSIKVLGTHFNVYSYDDEPDVKTTLLEGSVSISRPGVSASSSFAEAVILKAGEQAINNGNKMIVQRANIKETMAWRAGYFRFNDEPLESIMRKISRWYNIKVIYAPDVTKDINLTGVVSRSKNISAVLESITLTVDVGFKVEGRTITVLKNK